MKKILSILCMLILLMPFSVKAETKVIEIYNEDDLIELAKNCHFDGYSKGLEVELMNDIDLIDNKNFSLKIFDGVFRGNNHTIKNLIVDDKVSPYGFITFLGENGVIENLNIEGVILPEGDGNNIGGFVGVNDGIIENCSFQGTIKGKEKIGIAAGVNKGTISSFVSNGIVKGDNSVGGIVGENEGFIKNCTNNAFVNTQRSEINIDIEDIDLSSFDSLGKDSSFEDIGGIAGINAGEVLDSLNNGEIGYQHVGYNVGGIVGRNCGYIYNCINQAKIDGRKDVGGIVGHSEPDIINDISSSVVGRLRSQFNELNYYTNILSNNMEDKGNGLSAILEDISDESYKAIDALKDIDIEINVPEGGGINDIEVNADLSRFDDCLRSLANKSKELGSYTGDSISDLSDDIRNINNTINRISDTSMELINYEIESPMNDLSSVNIELIRKGRINSSVNYGEVHGDLNVGGISGVMGIEKDNSPEEDDLFSFDLDKSNSYELRLLISDCHNYGIIKSKRSNAGGIVGNQVLGYVYDNTNEGDVFSDSGSHVGGIAGNSSARISHNLAKCYLGGKKYIGGILGLGDENTTINDNYSMVHIEDYEQYIGSICGDNKGEMSKNYYYSKELYGVNGVSYSGKCEPIEYEEICSKNEIFKRLILSFEYNGDIVKSVDFLYGDSFNGDVYPVIINDEERVVFDKVDLVELTEDVRVHGEDAAYIKTIKYMSDGEETILCDGLFSDGDKLRIQPLKNSDESFIVGYRINIPDDGNKNHNIRLKSEDGIRLFVDGEEIEYETIGSYLSFDVRDLSHEIMLYKRANNYLIYYIVGGIVFISVLTILMLKHKSH